MAHVPRLKAQAQRRRRRRRVVLAAIGAVAVAVGVALPVWFLPTSKPTTVNVVTPPTSAVGGVPTTLAAPTTSVARSSTVPPVSSTQEPTVVYARPGVALVSLFPISPIRNAVQAPRPSQLYLSTDLVHWTKVTPPQSQVLDNGDYPVFEHASFLDASTGWVTAWNPTSERVTIYRTSNGGRTWSAMAGGDHSANAGATALIDLVSPTTAFLEVLEPSGPGMRLSVSIDAGRTWRTVYNGPPPTSTNGRLLGPFEMPMIFTDDRHGFAAPGIPPLEGLIGEGDFFSTSDGGVSWTRATPPLPQSPYTCPSGVNSSSAVSCQFAVPTFSDTNHAVLPATVLSGSQAAVAFDVTSDRGLHWALRSQRSTTVTPVAPVAGGVGRFGNPLVSVASPSIWWLLGQNPSGVTTQVTADAGADWTNATSPPPAGVPVDLEALDATHALLTVERYTPASTTIELLATTNGGRTWTTAQLAR